MTDYNQELAEVMANNKNLFASTGATGKAFMGVHDAAAVLYSMLRVPLNLVPLVMRLWRLSILPS